MHIPTKFMASGLTARTPGNSASASAVTALQPRDDPAATVLQALRSQDAALDASAAAYYPFFLSYSADFASGKPNPPGSGYHWSLLSSRFGVTPAFQQRLQQQQQLKK